MLSCKILNSLFSRIVVKVSDLSDLVQVFRAMYKYRVENRRCFQILMRTRSTYNAASNDSKSDTQIGLSVLKEISNSCNSIGKDLKRRVNSSGKMPQAKVRKTRSKTGFKDSDEAVETNQNLEVSKSEEKFKATTEIASKIKIENVAEDNETGDKVDRFEENNKTKQIGDLKQSNDDVSKKKTGKAKRKSSEFVKEEVKVEESENDTETKSKVVKIRNKRAKRGEIESSEGPQSNKSGKNPQTGGRIENIKIEKVEAIEKTEDEIQSSERVSRKSKISAAKNIEKSAKLEEKQIKSEYFSDSDYEEKEKVVTKREADLDILNESSLDSETEYLPKKKKKSEQKVKVKSASGEVNSKSAPKSSKTGASSKQKSSKDLVDAKNVKTAKVNSKRAKTSTNAGDDSNSDDEWEEIPGVNNKTDMMNRFSQMQNSRQDVTIVIEKDKNEAFMNWVGQIYRKHRKWQQIGVHKAYLMCCCAAGRYRNDICNSPLLQSLVYSLIPSEHLSKSKNSWNVESVKNFDSWFGKKFSFKDNSFGNKQVTIESLAKCIESKQCEFYTEYVMVFVCALRSLGFQCRLVWNLTRLPAVKKLGEMTEHEKKLADKILAEREKAKKIQADKLEDNQVNTGIKIENGVDKKEPLDDSSDLDSTDDSENVAAAPMIQENNTEDDIRALLMQTENYNPNNLISSDLKLSQETTSSYFNEENIVKVGKKGAKGLKKSSNAKGDKGKIAKKKNEKDDSSHSDSEAEEIQDSGVNFWVEVYLKKEAHWVCVSPVDKIYNKSYVIEKQAWKPVSYVFAFDNYNRMKDVTKRYALRWGSVNQKTRVEWIGKAEGKSWYESFCKIFAPLDKNFEAKEDVQIRDQMAHMPIPGTVAELKDHPLYVLERHLLKFEVLHPKTAPVLGYVRSEPVFSRKCVNICHTEQTWMKEGMSVKKGEEAVKFVKPLISKFKLRKLEREGQEVEMVGLYGGWQVELYKAPPVIDGRIPRNHYGNVELFKMHMLPPGSVFLDLPGLDKVAKELDVDCVSAMRGWDFSGCHARPVLEGFVVCAENEQLLRECWQEKKREAESKVRESRAVGNWKRIVRALRISQIIKLKYEYSNEPELTSRYAATSNSLDDFEEL